MAYIYRLLAQVIPGTNPATIYSVAASTQAIVRQINVINSGISECYIELFQNGSNQVNKIGRGRTRVPGNDGVYDGAIEYDCYYTMATGNTIVASAGITNALTVDIWGVEIT